MSNHAARAHPEARTNWGWWSAYVGLPVLVVVTVVVGWFVHARWIVPDNSWPAYDARVLGTRVENVGIWDSNYGGSVVYRVDVHASWYENGQMLEAWVPTRKTGSDKVYLEYWASRPGDRCTVREAPRNLGERFAVFW